MGCTYIPRTRFRFATRMDRGDRVDPLYRSFRKMRIDFPVRIGFRARPGYLCRCPSTMENGYNPVLYANGIDLRLQVNAVARL